MVFPLISSVAPQLCLLVCVCVLTPLITPLRYRKANKYTHLYAMAKKRVSLVDHVRSFTSWLLKIVLHWSTKQWPWIDWKVRALFLCFWPYSGLRTTWQTWQNWQNDQNHLALTWHFQWSLSTARTSGNSKAEWSTIQEWLLYQETIDHSESDFLILWWVQTDQNMVKTLYPKPQNGSKLGEVGKLAKIDSCLVQF